MQHIETVTVGAGGAASITFSAIPDTFTDLLLVLSGRSSYAGTRDDINVTFNSDTSSTYTYRRLIGYDSNSVLSGSATGVNAGFTITANSATSNTFGNTQIYIPNYRSTTTKSWSTDSVSENNSSTSWIMGISAHSFANSVAITSIMLDPQNGNFMEYSSASLYGILAGSDGIVSVS